MTCIDTIEFENGLTARIFHDADVEQPFSDDDAVRIVVLHQRYIDPACVPPSNGPRRGRDAAPNGSAIDYVNYKLVDVKPMIM